MYGGSEHFTVRSCRRFWVLTASVAARSRSRRGLAAQRNARACQFRASSALSWRWPPAGLRQGPIATGLAVGAMLIIHESVRAITAPTGHRPRLGGCRRVRRGPDDSLRHRLLRWRLRPAWARLVRRLP